MACCGSYLPSRKWCWGIFALGAVSLNKSKEASMREQSVQLIDDVSTHWANIGRPLFHVSNQVNV